MEEFVEQFVNVFSEQGISQYGVILSTIHGHLCEIYKNSGKCGFEIETMACEIAIRVMLRMNNING
jgi:hypothetical protein